MRINCRANDSTRIGQTRAKTLVWPTEKYAPVGQETCGRYTVSLKAQGYGDNAVVLDSKSTESLYQMRHQKSSRGNDAGGLMMLKIGRRCRSFLNGRSERKVEQLPRARGGARTSSHAFQD